VTHSQAVLAEFLGTFMLACMVFVLIDAKNQGRPMANLAPVFIGLTVSAMISIIAPLTQACFNPARDLGPRIVAYYAGWGSIAMPGLSEPSWITVYILTPIAGAIAGAGFQQLLLSRAYPHR
jgi:glycerol uptake facilitator protein